MIVVKSGREVVARHASFQREVVEWQREYNRRLSFAIDYIMTVPTTATITALYARLKPYGA